MIATLLILCGVYIVFGFVFAFPFVLLGVEKIDRHAAQGSWVFRLLIIPGVVAFWPMLFRRWMKGVHEPPKERNVHRQTEKGIAP